MDFDVLIVGGGLVGASLACAITDLKLALVDAGPRALGASPPLFDARVYALSPGTAGFLRRIGVWERIPAPSLTPVHAMQVWGDDGGSKIEFDAWDSGVGELAWIVEDRVLQAALGAVLRERRDIELHAPAQCAGLRIEADRALVSLQGGRQLGARLVVGADGAGSCVREHAGVEVSRHDYGQAAVVANFSCARPHGHVARQWFQGGPVLALLPLPGQHVSMVWSTREAEAARLAALSPAELCADVEAACAHALGTLELVTPAQTFPLRRLDAQTSVRQRIALVGDAAHVVHPLAGQGANLGFQDAQALAAVIGAREPGRDPGDRALLRRYERARAEAILAMGTTVHGLFGLFDGGGPLTRRLRNDGLKLVNRMAVVKNLLIRQAMQ